ncbi:NAD(P)-binding protein [Penicillium angulare]|uniref:NAD(P)-binding protein n=1 Tax=Penicillium angulare TaxID=116970 RepID=UPI0025407D57|nr:NAD(P)-binding protein [Penicillium angulare]KAJ5288975.1 NAD(P)-binding protein [Penicillium angulare]
MAPPTSLGEQTVWFVTGCSSGLGKAFARAIYSAGHRIVATARDITSLSYLPDCPTVLKIKLDVTSQQAIENGFTEALAKFNEIYVVINNAGYGLMGDMEAITESDARHQLETNFWGPVHVTQQALKVFREINPKGRGGTIVQVSSVGGFLTAPGHSFYHASKFALEGFTKSVSKEVRPEWNINFLTLSPGGVRTNFAESSLLSPPRHAAYNLPDGAFSQLVAYIQSQTTWSDPDNCARVLFDCVVRQNERPLPTRLLMGSETIPYIREEIKHILEEVGDWEAETSKCS